MHILLCNLLSPVQKVSYVPASIPERLKNSHSTIQGSQVPEKQRIEPQSGTKESIYVIFDCVRIKYVPIAAVPVLPHTHVHDGQDHGVQTPRQCAAHDEKLEDCPKAKLRK